MEDLLLETAHTYHGFLLEKTEQLEDICSAGYLFRHTQSGARLLYLKNNDKNKVFSVAFKTPPENSCGTPIQRTGERFAEYLSERNDICR